jgi:anti-anti-sigma factor
MSIHTEKIGQNLHLVAISGPLNESQFKNITETFSALAKQGIEQVIISLKNVPFVDSRGLAALVTGYKTFGRMPQNFRLAEMSNQPRLVFELTGFDRIFEIFGTVADAAESNTGLLLDLRQPVTIPVRIDAVVM